MKVIKSSGLAQDFDQLKILKVLEWACCNTSIDPYKLLDYLKDHIVDNMKTEDIQKTLVKVSSNLITTEQTDYQYVASNLEHFGLRKSVYGQFDPICFYDHIRSLSELGIYDSEILLDYTKEEIEEIEKFIDHNLDFKYTYAGTQQLIEKYLVKDRSTGKIYETPQYAFALISMCLHSKEDKSNRLNYIKDFYLAVAHQEVSLPTPIMAGVRTPTRQFSSCIVMESGDSLKSIKNANGAIIEYIARRAGIGINGGAIRAEGSKIRQGEVKHTGVTPFYKTFAASTASSSQGGIRKGSANLNYPFWHLEFENMIVLKNNKGTEDNRIRHIDYTVQFNDMFYRRYMNNDYVTLFSPDVANGELYKLFFEDEVAFEKLYTELELDASIRKKRVKATEIFNTQFLNERANTARVYPSNIDNVNNYGPWIRSIAPVKMTNLCLAGDSVIHVIHNGVKKKVTMKQVNELYHRGDKLKVLSYDTKKKKQVYKRITNSALMNKSAKVMKITDESGNSITCTPDHKIWTENRGYVEAKNLLASDKLLIK